MNAISPSLSAATSSTSCLNPEAFWQDGLPELIEGLGKAQHPRVLLTVLESYVQNATLPFFAEGLAKCFQLNETWS